jgi:hypothetical protein
MQMETPEFAGRATADYFVRPEVDPTNYFEPARKAARKRAAIATICICLVLLVTACVAMIWLAPEDRKNPKMLLEIGAVVFLAGLGVWSAASILWTKIWQRRLAAAAIKQAGKIQSRSIQLIEQSKDCQSNIHGLLDESGRMVDNADCELKAGRFSQFWDRIEQAAATLAEIQTVIDRLKLMQDEYEKLLADHPHNLPSVLPGNSESYPDVTVIDHYYAAIARGLSKIDCQLIWQHRQTLPAKINGFATFGEMVQKVGESVRRALGALA